MHASPARQRRTSVVAYGRPYEPSERGPDQLLDSARATSALCIVFMMLLVVL